ncbi:RNA-binding domain-containing protein [Pollutibacter soli]|uniref:RNA-binding domain-containing protein n=1 Tax=Pollutibacter soli TaxID=3034157 RepID=UPI003013EE90
MTHDEIEKIVGQHIALARQGGDEEYRKVEFKLQWYNLKDPKEIMEFLKDLTAIANSFGPDGFIIIGFHAERGFQKATLKDSNLKDESDLVDLVNKEVDRIFHFSIYEVVFEGNLLSVIHIPPSIDKPHIIRKFRKWDKKENETIEEHKIYVRYGKTCRIATRSDIELMYYDRKNIIPEYKLSITVAKYNLHFSGALFCMVPFTFENIGSRALAIEDIFFTLKFGDRIDDYYTLDFQYSGVLVVSPGEIKFEHLKIHFTHAAINSELKHKDILHFNGNRRLATLKNFIVQNTRKESIPIELNLID